MKNFSVLMSFYKNENPNTLKLSLKSIVDQKLKPTEIILVQDGPVNSILRSVVEEFQVLNNNCKVIELEKNVGLGRALNIGLKECQYDYVARIAPMSINGTSFSKHSF
ncbi:glycosyltransferase [Latilactobacillus curvatus]|uniref:glycosyltransferase n=1 Tax=Latilactobacillus curvatus TaxID=28038 RepID=UPI00345EB2DF